MLCPFEGSGGSQCGVGFSGRVYFGSPTCQAIGYEPIQPLSESTQTSRRDQRSDREAAGRTDRYSRSQRARADHPRWPQSETHGQRGDTGQDGSGSTATLGGEATDDGCGATPRQGQDGTSRQGAALSETEGLLGQAESGEEVAGGLDVFVSAPARRRRGVRLPGAPWRCSFPRRGRFDRA